MTEPITIARPYAEAAFKLAQEHQGCGHWSEMLQLIEAIVTDGNIASRIGDPSLDAEALQSVILGMLGDRLDGQGRTLVQVLVQNQRLELVPQIRALYEQLRRDHEGVREAKIISAFPIAPSGLRPLIAALEAKYKCSVKVEVEVDSSLIGGVRVVVGDEVIDATVRGRLDAMATALAT